MNILDKIIAFKRSELECKKKCFPVSKFENSAFFKREMPSFHDALAKPGPSLIGEFKRKSPSNGMININAETEQVARGYEEAGIAAMSIITDMEFFGGADHDLQNVAGFVKIPLLRKDFIVDEYQVVESKSIGASAILLIATVLSKKEVGALTELSLNLGMDVLFEIYDEKDLEKMSHKIKIIGVNNRNLKTFEVSMDHSRELFSRLPENCLKVAESGFQTYKEVTKLFTTGYNAFLIGGKFMKSKNPGKAAARFMKDLKKEYGMSLMIKICGMREPENMLEVANLKPDLMGFIFYLASPRYAAKILNPEIFTKFPPGIRKVGVFVNTDFDEINETIRKYSLDMVQLHGDESSETCRRLSEAGIHVIKSFNIKDSTGFKLCAKYIPYTNYFLFDASTSKYGGSGYKFDWKILDNYELGHPFFLSGGIAPGDVYKILEITNPAFYGIDLNSKFEVKTGLKDVKILKKFVTDVRNKNKSL